MQYYAELNCEYFYETLNLKQIPSHDTFSRIMQLTDFNELSTSLGAWLRTNFPDIAKKYSDMKVLHVDGKAVRAATRKSAGEKPVYELNAMYEGESIGVTVQQIGDKQNETSCLPDYLRQFNLENTIVTIDAAGCCPNVINTIINAGGHYAIPVKENQIRLYKAINSKVEELIKSNKFDDLPMAEKLTKDHGRIEKITARIIENTDFLFEALGTESFFGSIGKIAIIDKDTTLMVNGEEENPKSRCILITDLESIDVETMLKLRVSHWNIEKMHWLLDMQLLEDRQTARKGNATINGAILRRFCLMVRMYDQEYQEKPLKRFLMANDHSATRIESLLFGKVAQE